MLETINYNKGVGSLIFGRKFKVRFTFVLWSTFEQTILKLDVCAFIISFRRFSNAKSSAENTYHDRVWLFLAVFVCSSTNLCMSTGVDNLYMYTCSLKLSICCTRKKI